MAIDSYPQPFSAIVQSIYHSLGNNTETYTKIYSQACCMLISTNNFLGQSNMPVYVLKPNILLHVLNIIIFATIPNCNIFINKVLKWGSHNQEKVSLHTFITFLKLRIIFGVSQPKRIQYIQYINILYLSTKCRQAAFFFNCGGYFWHTSAASRIYIFLVILVIVFFFSMAITVFGHTTHFIQCNIHYNKK